MDKLLNTKVYIFYTSERTLDLCVYSFKKLGLNNIVVLDGSDSFKSKYVRCANDAMKTNDDFFIRTDADRIVYSGMLDILASTQSRDDMWIEGKYYDYFMNRLRGGTPHVVPRKAMGILAFDNDVMPNSKKPESDFSSYLRDNELIKFKHVDTITNLHDFGQYPSKACNTFLNRLKRGHNYLYDSNYLSTLPEYYKRAIQHAIDVFESKEYEHEDSMNFADFSFLDEGFPSAEDVDIENTYKNMLELYNNVIKASKT